MKEPARDGEGWLELGRGAAQRGHGQETGPSCSLTEDRFFPGEMEQGRPEPGLEASNGFQTEIREYP